MRGLFFSALLHGAVLAGLVVSWPYMRREASEVVPIVPIELISEAELAELVSVPEERESPEPEPEDEPAAPEEPEPLEETPPAEPEPAPEPETPAPPVPEEDEAPEEPEPTPEPEATPEPAPEEPKEDDPLAGLDDALIDLDPDKEDRATPREVAEDETGSDRDVERVGSGAELTITEEAALQAAFARCWRMPSGVPEPEKLVVEVRVKLNLDGTVAGAPRVLNDNEIRRSGNRFWMAARTQALSAVAECAPYDTLPESLRTEVFDFAFRPDAR